MVTKKITITLPEGHLEQARVLAEAAGMPLSTWIAEVVEHEARIQAGLAALREWDELDGPLTEDELAAAEAELARADAAAAASRESGAKQPAAPRKSAAPRKPAASRKPAATGKPARKAKRTNPGAAA